MRDSRAAAARDCGGWATSSGAFYTPLAVAIALVAWAVSGEPIRFLAVLVVATPCPLLIAIPVAIIGSISLAARRGIIIKDPAVLETDRHLPHRDLRQDRHADLRRAAADRGDRRARASTATRCSRWSPAWSGTRSTRWPRRSSTRPRERRRRRCGRPARSASGPARGCAATSADGTIQVTSRKQAASPSIRELAATAPADRRRPGVRRPDRRPLRRDVPVPRRAAGRGRLVHQPPRAASTTSTA